MKFFAASATFLFALVTGTAFGQTEDFNLDRRDDLMVPSNIRASQGSRGDYGPRRRYRRRSLNDEDFFNMLVERRGLEVPSNIRASQGSRGDYGPRPHHPRGLEGLILEAREADAELWFEDAEN